MPGSGKYRWMPAFMMEKKDDADAPSEAEALQTYSICAVAKRCWMSP